eukprot:GEMP01061887.1.p1 GENE.GEMP01061887.1~~GEMP01061887.1.p1  ORF type:complete len:292 (-),score=33.43 GEMP01061887.1:521-1366(-)
MPKKVGKPSDDRRRARRAREYGNPHVSAAPAALTDALDLLSTGEQFQRLQGQPVDPCVADYEISLSADSSPRSAIPSPTNISYASRKRDAPHPAITFAHSLGCAMPITSIIPVQRNRFAYDAKSSNLTVAPESPREHAGDAYHDRARRKIRKVKYGTPRDASQPTHAQLTPHSRVTTETPFTPTPIALGSLTVQPKSNPKHSFRRNVTLAENTPNAPQDSRFSFVPHFHTESARVTPQSVPHRKDNNIKAKIHDVKTRRATKILFDAKEVGAHLRSQKFRA